MRCGRSSSCLLLFAPESSPCTPCTARTCPSNGQTSASEQTISLTERWADRFATYDQPIVYQTPHSGQKTLLVSEFFTSHVVELPREEGEALLQNLFSRLYADDNVYTHMWQTNDVIIWDNMALQHCRPADMGTATRRMRRQSLDGWYADDGMLDWPETVIAYARAD